MNIEELYCFVNEHPIYLVLDAEKWKAAVERKLGQIYVGLPPASADDRLPDLLAFAASCLQDVAASEDEVKARAKLAQVVDVAMYILADRYTGAERHFYDAGIYVLRISLCANAAVGFLSLGSEVRGRRAKAQWRRLAEVYEKEVRAVGGRLARLVSNDSFTSDIVHRLGPLAELAIAGADNESVHKAAEAIVLQHGFHTVPVEIGDLGDDG